VVDLPQTRSVYVRLVRLSDGIAFDALRGSRRVARIDVPDAHPGGRPLELDPQCGYARGFCFRWLNRGERTPVVHAYRLTPRGRAFEVIG
jgi:hypothetical protein